MTKSEAMASGAARPCELCERPTMRPDKRCEPCWMMECAIHARPALARQILARLDPPAKPRARAVKEVCPDGWSAGAWEHLQAAKRSKTYDALAPQKLAQAAMRACDKTEEIVPNATFRARIRYSADPDHQKAAAAAAVAWGKLGASQIHYQSAEEHASELRDISVRTTTIHLQGVALESDLGTYRRKGIQRELVHARGLARDLLKHGEREEAKDLARLIRSAENTHWPRK